MSENRVCTAKAQSSTGADDALRSLFDQHFSVELAVSPELIDEAQTLRYQVYCRERPFEDATCFPDGRERDAYDDRSAHALVRHRSSNECVAAVRLILADTEDPAALFPVESHCSEAMPDAGVAVLERTPRKRIGEISRLAISREIRQQMSQSLQREHTPPPTEYDADTDAQAASYIVIGLFSAVLRLSAKLGITHWLAVMEPTLLRLLKRYGIHFPHVGPVIDYHGRRKPAVAQASTLLDGIRVTRPDVWNLLTDAGSVVPTRPIVSPRPTTGIAEKTFSHQAVAKSKFAPHAVSGMSG